jgi:protein gp37
MAKRLAGRVGYPEAPNQFRLTLHPDRLFLPLRWKKPSRIFVDSMSDLFHPEVPDYFITQVFAVMAIARQHQFQILTKRPSRMNEIVTSGFATWVEAQQEQICGERGWCAQEFDWPLPNVWLGVSVEDQKASDGRLPWLLKTPAVVKFVSVEPMLGPVNLGWDINRLNWIIIGAESGPGARAFELQWAFDLVRQCRDSEVPVFVKQLRINGKLTHDLNDFPEELRVREYPVIKNFVPDPLLVEEFNARIQPV